MPVLNPPAGQNFECRDCPARCCKTPWRIVLKEEDKARFEAEPWIQERLARQGVSFQRFTDSTYLLPSVVQDRKLQCVFLDEDNFCSMYKKHGRDFWPQACRTFPFEFIDDGSGVTQPVLSHYCPSIRDNYGEPVTLPRLEGFLKETGGIPDPLSPVQDLGVQTKLSLAQSRQLTDLWAGLIQATPSLAEGLFACHQLTEHIETELLEVTGPDDAAWSRAVENARAQVAEPLSPVPPARRESALLPNLVLSLQLSNLAWPVRTYFNAGFSWSRLLPVWQVRSKLIRESGTVDLLLTPAPFRLEEAAAISTVLPHPALVEKIRDFLLLVLRRRYFLRRETAMSAHLFQLILAYVTILRFARYHAAARKSAQAEWEDIREGISVAELLITLHNYPPGPVLGYLVSLFAGNTLSLRKLLLSEI